MFNTSTLRTKLINEKQSKVLCVDNNGHHFETTFDYPNLVDLKNNGWYIYIINEEGIFFFTANSELDGNDFTKITKK